MASEKNRGWSEDACLQALQDCAEDLEESPSKSRYRDWREKQDDPRPGKTAIANKFGSWNAAKEAADLVTYQQGGPAKYRSVGKHRRSINGP